MGSTVYCSGAMFIVCCGFTAGVGGDFGGAEVTGVGGVGGAEVAGFFVGGGMPKLNDGVFCPKENDGAGAGENGIDAFDTRTGG